MAIKARYLGDGADFITGIPPRHIDEAEWAALTPEQQEAVRTTVANGKPLYKITPDREPAAAPAPAKASPQDKAAVPVKEG